MYSFLRRLLITSVALVIFGGNAVTQAAVASDLMNKGMNAEVVLSPGRTVEQVRQELGAINRAILQESLTKNEQAIVQRWKQEQLLRMAVPAPQASGTGDGNTFNGALVENGAVLLGYNNNSWWCSLTSDQFCHAGLWDRNAWLVGRNPTTPSIRTSNTGRGERSVYLETPSFWNQGFRMVAELGVAGASTPGARDWAVQMATSYQGRYWLDTWKWDNSYWYCSKVVWRAYHDTAKVDIDGDGGIWVFPNDIWKSAKTEVVRLWD